MVPLLATDVCPVASAWTMLAADLNRAAAAALVVVVEVVAVAAVVASEAVEVVAVAVVVAAVEVAVVVASVLVLTALLPLSLAPRFLSIKRGLMHNGCELRASGGFTNKWAFVGCRFNTRQNSIME